MAGIGGFRGVSASQDARFVNKQERMLRTKKFPKELDLVIDYSRIVWPVIREWTAKRVTELFGVEDEVLIQFIHNRLENTQVITQFQPDLELCVQDLNPKELYLELIPFLEKNAGLFMKELWTLLASAASSSTGIPQSIMDAKAEELKQRKEQQELVRQTIEIERKKVIAIQEEAKQAAKRDETKPDSSERRRESTLHSSEKSENRPRHHRSKFSALPRKSDDHHRHRQPRSRRRHDPHRHHRTSKRDRRSMRSPSKTRSLSRSPPESRHCSPPPRTSNLPLARKRQHHDKKSRSPAGLNRGRGARDGATPTTKSPSPRSHNRMSLTPQKREKTPSPPSHHSSKTPTPKPSTPPTQQDFKNLDRGHSRFRVLEESRGSSYRFDGSQVRCGYQERSPRKDYNNSSRYLHHKSNRNYDRSRRGYAYRPASPPRLQSYERPRRRHRSPSSSSFDEIDKSKKLSSSDSFDSPKEGVKRRRHDKSRAKLDEKGPKKPDPDPQDSDDSLERKEKMEEKLSGILKRKDSLGLE